MAILIQPPYASSDYLIVCMLEAMVLGAPLVFGLYSICHLLYSAMSLEYHITDYTTQIIFLVLETGKSQVLLTGRFFGLVHLVRHVYVNLVQSDVITHHLLDAWVSMEIIPTESKARDKSSIPCRRRYTGNPDLASSLTQRLNV